MDYPQFIELVKSVTHVDKAVATSYNRRGATLVGNFIQVSWTTGGESGGSCWDSGESVHHPVSTDREPEFTELDLVLEKVYPDLSFLGYKEVIRELVHYTDYTRDEYYGNYYIYGVKYVNLQELYDFLRKKGKV